MALDNNTVVNYTDKTTIKNWFKTGLKPTQAQFWSTWDSFWHKSESLPISSITNLSNLLDGKAEENHEHNQYATNDATSLTADNVTEWQQKLGVADLKFDDKAITTTQDYAYFGLQAGATINAFNNAVYEAITGGEFGENFSNTDLEITENRKHTGTASVELAMPMIYSNESQQFSGLVDKSADATYNKVMMLNADGKAGTKNADDLDYIPLSGTEVGKPLVGSIEISSELSEPLFTRALQSDNLIYEESLSINNGFNYSNTFVADTNGDNQLGIQGHKALMIGVQSGTNIMSAFGHQTYNDTIGSISITNGLCYMAFSEGVSSLFNFDDLRPLDDMMFTQRSYVKRLIGNFSKPTNWTNSQQRFSGLVDKSADATYDKVMVLDSEGKAGVKNLNTDTLIDILTNATPEQINQIKTLLEV